MQTLVYPIIQGFIVFVVMIILMLMVLRLIANYTDPNPFSFFGRMSFKLKKMTDRFVYPIGKFLVLRNVDPRISPLIVILIAIVIGFFVLQLFYNLFFMIDGVVMSVRTAQITKVVGYLLYGFIGIYTLAIFIRIILSWLTSATNKVLRWLSRITDPVLEPFRRLIPPLGMFDISPIIVLLILHFLQAAVLVVFGLGRV
ncbi:MAG: YggT family protein [Acidobacteria bacterium]|nr:MAG: YggT family protein [Acidobacteriota bacterium]REK03973.1 MAG: YggT family protein [Acidobacteriota bacterium]REK15135.1 MAG: YggT family protein [Acidobacteriota bacterium]REK46225.1 MAG: YggT family protein [Acidobacteriota bacterium]